MFSIIKSNLISGSQKSNHDNKCMGSAGKFYISMLDIFQSEFYIIYSIHIIDQVKDFD